MKIQLDKLIHFETTMLIVFVFYIANYLWIGISLAIICSIGKEIFDYFKYGKDMEKEKFSKMVIGDLIADLAGILSGLILIYLIN